MSRLRCHELDRRDELESIEFNRQLRGGPDAERRRLEENVELARIELANFEKRERNTDRWIQLLKDSLDHHWIDDPDAYIKDWESRNPH